MFDIPEVYFKDYELINILIRYLNIWTEISLSEASGYDLDDIKFYDGFIGFIIKKAERYLNDYPDILTESEIKFINSWKYQGKLYRILHANHVENYKTKSGYSYRLPKVQYHGMISHWTDDYTFNGLMYKLNTKRKYIILEADTQDHIGFDVNKFRKAYNCEKPNTENEREIIFPMYKECIIHEHHISVEEFIQLKQK